MAQHVPQVRRVLVLDNDFVNFFYQGTILKTEFYLSNSRNEPVSFKIRTPNPRISIPLTMGLLFPSEVRYFEATWQPNEMDILGDLNLIFIQMMPVNVHFGIFVDLPALWQGIENYERPLRCILPPIVIAANPNEMVPQLEEAVDAGGAEFRRALPPVVIPENGNGEAAGEGMVPQLEVVNDLDYSVADIVNNVDIPALEGITDLFLRKFLIKKGFTAMEDSALIQGFSRLHRFLENTLGQSFGMEFLSLPRFLRRYYGEAVDRQPFPNFGTFLPSLKETQNRQYIVVFFKNRPHLDERKMNKYLDKLSKY